MPPTPIELREFVRMHQVCYRIWPDLSYFSGERRQIGFLVELYGTHEHPEHVEPGCNECRRAYEHLAHIARAVLPNASTHSQYPIEAFRPAIHYPTERAMRPEIELTIRIEHKHEFLSPVDDCERTCLRSIVRRLEELGIQRGHYTGQM